MMNGRIDNDILHAMFSLGDLYVSNFIPMDAKSEDFQRGNLTLAMGNRSRLVQLTEGIDLDVMYRKYWYNSGTNRSMIFELKDIVNTCLKHLTFKAGDSWLDIGCNDGTLFKQLPPEIKKIGIDPSNSALAAKEHADEVINEYFSYDKVKHHGRYKFITAIAMFYDLDDPAQFLREIKESLTDDGIFVVQMSYLPLMLEQMAFDNICHEHLTYYSLTVLNKLFKGSGLVIRDCQINDTNGGSFRIYAQRDDSNSETFATAPFRDVANFRVESTLAYEDQLDLDKARTYDIFYQNILSLGDEVRDLIRGLKKEGKAIWGYGASTKGNTLLQYFGLDHKLIDGIAERQSIKYGLKTIGTEIPIHSEADMRKANPDYLLMLPWHFVYEFSQREHEYLNSGGKFIVPCPKLQVIGG